MKTHNKLSLAVLAALSSMTTPTVAWAEETERADEERIEEITSLHEI